MGLLHTGAERWWEAPLAVLLPPLCQLCDAPVAPDELVCDGCVGRFSFIRAGCLHCAGGGVDVPRCPRCEALRPPWARAHALVIYEDTAARAVQALKFHGRRSLARALGALMGCYAAACPGPRPDVVTWVPVAPARLRSRGYDQAYVLAQGVAAALGVAPTSTLVRRSGRTQSGQGRSRRGENTSEAFALRPDGPPLGGRRVLLVDDVLTTGATAITTTRQLLAGGAAAVEVLTFARAP